MPRKPSQNPADYVVPLNINGLEGRMLRVPAPDTKSAAGKEILFIYGHHSSLERWWGLAQVLNRYGAVTMPDLPGFGGMDSFYKVGKKPTTDNLADYLAAFIKLRYKRQKVIVVGMSFGFVVVTRMLQRYPELAKQVRLLVGIVGFAHKDDLSFSKPRYYTYLWGARLLSLPPMAWFFRYVVCHPVILRNFYGRTHNAKHKFAQAKDEVDLELIEEVEIGLWHDNDVRTWAYTTVQLLTLDNCRVRVDLPLWQITVKNDNYFDNSVVEQHLRVIFSDYKSAEIDIGTHAPSTIADARTAAAWVPSRLRRAISRLK